MEENKETMADTISLQICKLNRKNWFRLIEIVHTMYGTYEQPSIEKPT